MKKLYIITGFVFLTLVACPQKREQTFLAPANFTKGFYMPNGKLYTEIPTGISSVTWDMIQGKPVNFLPSPHRHLWTDITNNPDNMTLNQAIEAMEYLPIPQKTTLEISKIIPSGVGIVFNSTDSVLQVYYGKKWHNFILDK